MSFLFFLSSKKEKMKRPCLIIAPGKEKAILRRHPWIFSGAVKRIEGEPQEGDLVDVVDAHGQWMATGHYQNESIICKVLSFDTPDINEDFFRARFRSAINYRVNLGFFNYLSPFTSHLSPRPDLREAVKRPIGEWRNLIVNDFEASVFPAHPAIAALKEEMYRRGALYASMTGSGAAVFGIFAV